MHSLVLLVSYSGHSLGESYPSAEMKSMYSTAPADGANEYKELHMMKSLSNKASRLVLVSLVLTDWPITLVSYSKLTLVNNYMCVDM